MKVTAEAVVGRGPGVWAHEAAGLLVSWRGFVFEPGHPSGAPSIERFAARAARDGVAAAATGLRGLYLLAVEDPARRETHAFVDPTGMHHAYWSRDGAGADFLALARARRCTAADLDPEAVAELILQGHLASRRTFFASIRRIAGGEVIALPWDGGAPRAVAKPLPPVWEPPGLDLMAQLEQLVPALAGHRLSLDLTGGADTRLVAVALAALGVPFETATSGDEDGDEVRIARRVAALLGREHNAVPHRPETLEQDLDDLLLGSGCLVDPLLSHRELQLQRWRAARGIDLVVHGLGGELFRDYYWLQDFPRYRSPQADLERLWRLRFQRTQTRAPPLAGAYADAAPELQARAVERLGAYRRPTNTHTYDAVAFYVRLPDLGGRSLTNRSRVIPTYAPLMELDAVRVGFDLSRRMRAFHRYHRETVTRLAPEVARLPTTEAHMTLSAAPGAVAVDALRWPADKARRVFEKRLLPPSRRRPALESPLPPLLRILRTLPVLDASVARLADEGILTPGATAAQLADGSLGPVVALARLLDELGP